MADPDLTRRRALAGAAIGGLSLPLLAACGSGSSSTDADGDNDGDSSASSQPSKGSSSDDSGSSDPESLTSASDVPVGGGVINKDANVVITQPSKGTFEGFSATCTHQGCQLASVSAGTINCPCHGSQFSIKTGANVTGPNGSPAGSVAALGKIAVKDQGGQIVKA